MPKPDLLQDIEFVRTLAQEGRTAPPLGGRFMAFWGALFTATLLVHWAIVTDRLPAPPSALLGMWVCMGVVGGLVSMLIGRSMRTAPGAGAANNRATSAVWTAMPLALVAGFGGVYAAVTMFGAPVFLWTMIPAIALLLYGMAYLSSAFFAQNTLSILAGLIALGAGAATIALVQSADAYVVAAIGVFTSTFVPGLVMMMGEPKTTV